jgi:hypothetical protein
MAHNMMPISLLLRFWKPLAGALVLAMALWAWHAHYKAGYKAGQAQVRALWDADEAAEAKVAADQIAANKLHEAAVEARNEEIARENDAKTAATLADNDRLRRLLASARAAASSGRAAQGDSEPVADAAGSPRQDEGAGATAPESDLAARIDAAIADALTEARQNADQLDALQAEIRPQLTE